MASGNTQARQPGTLRQPGQRGVSLPAPLALSRRDGFRSLLVFLAVALLLFAADIALLSLHSGGYRVDVGNYRDKFFLDETNFQEVAPDGATYRWTTGDSTLYLGQIDITSNAILTLEFGGRPTPTDVQLMFNGKPWVNVRADVRPHHEQLLLPPSASGDVAIGIKSDTFTPPGDSRRLGVKIEGFRLDFPRGSLPMPTPAHYLAQLALVLLTQLSAVRLGLRWRGQALLLGALAIGLAALLTRELLLAYDYLPSLAIAGALLTALTWLLLPHAERLSWLGSRREIRILWAIMLAACAIRLLGMLYPTFDGQDLGRNVRRQLMSMNGQMYIIAGSSEFASGQTIYPTGPYIFLMPGLLVSADVGKLIETVLTILEGTTTFLVAMLARRLGGGREAARFAALLFLCSYASFSVHVYQFSAQIFGQWFTVPIALVLLASERRPTLWQWSLAILLLLFGVYSHIGVAILSVSWVGLMLLLSLRRPSRDLWIAIGVFAAGLLGALFFMYLDIAAESLAHAGSVVQGHGDNGRLLPGATPLLLKGLRLGYTDIGALLLPFGLALLAWRRPSLDRLLVPLAMVVTVLVYMLIDMAFLLQVRYFFFAVPFAFALIALPLGMLAGRGRAGRLAAWALVLAIVAQNVALWFTTAFGDGFISMTPLTH